MYKYDVFCELCKNVQRVFVQKLRHIVRFVLLMIVAYVTNQYILMIYVINAVNAVNVAYAYYALQTIYVKDV